MQRTRRVLAAMAFLLGVVALFPGAADAVFLGELKRGEPWTIEITPATTPDTAVTVLGLTESGISVIEVIRMTPESPQAIVNSGAIGRKIRRISIDVSPSPNGINQIRITQGTNVIVFDAVGDVVVTVDIVP